MKVDCLIVDEDIPHNHFLQEHVNQLGLSSINCDGLFSCQKCTFEPDVVILGPHAKIPSSAPMGNVEIMIRENFVPVLVPHGSEADNSVRFQNYHTYGNIRQIDQLIKSVVNGHRDRIKIRQENIKLSRAIGLIEEGELEFKTLSEAQALSSLLGNMTKNTNPYIKLGLCELFINSIEHGNLGLDSFEKFELRKKGKWLNEIETRMKQDAFKDRKVKVHLERKSGHVDLTIQDQGQGFEWKDYMNDKSLKPFSKSRGLKVVQEIGFENLAFHGNGNTVTCRYAI